MRGTLETLLYNERGLRSGWRLLAYIVFVFCITVVSGAILREFIRPARGAFSPGYLAFTEAWTASVVLVAALIMARIERRPFGVYGLGFTPGFVKRFLQGVALGLAEASALIGLIAALGGYSFGSLATHGTAALRWGAFWALFFFLVGIFEEFTFRGYTLYTLADGIGFWPAAIALSLLFGGVHLKNRGEDIAGACAVVIIGLIFALSLKRTGTLWFAVGMHAGFDYAETFLFSVPNSGAVFTGHLSNAAMPGPAWLTGGSVGPEASVFSFVTMAAVAVVIHLWFPATPKPRATVNEAPQPAQ
ncbi:MAG TPA: type II CAAX endopeptidase family protein [Candidatus Acidoferrales bacterium]|nr:type II CAAX endopeptidase family protein [Candidatus Acidoferrales bacterium]